VPLPPRSLPTAGTLLGDDAFSGPPSVTLTRAKLTKIKRRGRLGWWMALLFLSMAAAGLGRGLEEHERLQSELRQTKWNLADAQKRAERAAQRASVAAQQVDELAVSTTKVAEISEANQKLIAQLQSQLDAKEGEISSEADRITVNLVDSILFSSGEADLTLGGYRVLARVGKILKEVSDKQVLIGGHTDDRPIKTEQFPSNWELSSARAVNVARYLIDEIGIEPRRVAASAYSQFRPRSPNRAKNRRIEVLLTPLIKVTMAPPQTQTQD
jgi:chemotaxis protein MotB